MNWTPLQQQHLRTLRRSLNRAVTVLREGGQVVVPTGWGYGRAFTHPRLQGGEEPWPEMEGLHLLFAPSEEGSEPPWRSWAEFGPPGLEKLLSLAWPGPLILEARCPQTRRALRCAAPWHPLMQELLARSGPCLWLPLTTEEMARLSHPGPADAEPFSPARTLRWPEVDVHLQPTVLDVRSRPWRLLREGFLEYEEIVARLEEPVILSEERAFPRRALRTFRPQHRTVVLEAARKEELPQLVERFRELTSLEWSLRVYLEETIAHRHFPDDRYVRVYGEMSDPERVRRRLEAMLERQRRRSGKRILLIGVAELESSAESLKADLRKLADRWIVVESGESFVLEEFR